VAQVFEDRSVALMLIHERLVRMNASFVGTKGLDDRGRVTWLVRTSDALVRTSDAFVSMNASLMRMSDAFVRMKRGTRRTPDGWCAKKQRFRVWQPGWCSSGHGFSFPEGWAVLPGSSLGGSFRRSLYVFSGVQFLSILFSNGQRCLLGRQHFWIPEQGLNGTLVGRA